MAAILDFRSEHFFYFWSTRHPKLPTPIRAKWPFGSGEQVKSRWPPSWISDQQDFPTFIYKSPWCFRPSFKSIGLLVQEKKRKIDFQDGGHLWFPIGTISATFDLQVTSILLIYKSPRCFLPSFESIGLSVQKKVKNRFSKLPPLRPSRISDMDDFSYFWITSHPRCFLQSVKSISLSV